MEDIEKIAKIKLNRGELIGLCLYLFVSLVLFVLGCLFVTEREKTNLRASGIAFVEAVRKEKEQYIKIYSYQYDSQLSPNTISGEEKLNWGNQLYLAQEDPNRHRLDSIFQAELGKRKIPGTVAIRYTIGDKVTVSRPEFPFEDAIALDGVSYRKDLDDKQRITIQPYLYMSRYWWVDYWPVYVFGLVWLFGTGGLAFVYKLKKRNRQQSVKTVEGTNTENTDVEPMQTKLHRPEVKIEWTILPGDFAFDKKHGVLKLGAKEVVLSGDSLTYFRHLIRKENFMLTYQEIFKYVYGTKKEEITKSDRSRITHGIERLQSQLDNFEGIKLILVRGNGYQLEISNERATYMPD